MLDEWDIEPLSNNKIANQVIILKNNNTNGKEDDLREGIRKFWNSKYRQGDKYFLMVESKENGETCIKCYPENSTEIEQDLKGAKVICTNQVLDEFRFKQDDESYLNFKMLNFSVDGGSYDKTIQNPNNNTFCITGTDYTELQIEGCGLPLWEILSVALGVSIFLIIAFMVFIHKRAKKLSKRDGSHDIYGRNGDDSDADFKERTSSKASLLSSLEIDRSFGSFAGNRAKSLHSWNSVIRSPSKKSTISKVNSDSLASSSPGSNCSSPGKNPLPSKSYSILYAKDIPKILSPFQE